MGNNRLVSGRKTRPWYLLPAASATTLGLVCGLVQPALAEWWKLGHSDRQSTQARSTPVESGFAATIRRLTTESRRAADQGDFVKAVQIAERAAKISEAAAQVIGPSSDCSPEETRRFLAEVRARSRGGTTVPSEQPIASNSASGKVSHTVPEKDAKHASASPVSIPQTASHPPTPPQHVIAAAPKFPETLKYRETSAPSQPAVDESPSQVTGSALFGPVMRQSVVAAADQAAASEPLDQFPSEPQPALTADDLLAESRLAAADGELERAIDLAQRAMDSAAPALFGPPIGSSTDEASRWMQYLISLRTSPSRDTEALPPPAKMADASQNIAQAAPQAAETTSGRDASGDTPASDQARAVTVAQSHDRPSAEPSAAKPDAGQEALWREDLTPSPAPKHRDRPRREAIQFSRSVISRSGGWVDADSDHSMNAPVESRASIESTDPAETAGASVENAELSSIQPSAADVKFVVPEELHPSTVDAAQTSAELKSDDGQHVQRAVASAPIRLRGGIIQVGAGASVDRESQHVINSQVAPFNANANVPPNLTDDDSDVVDSANEPSDLSDAPVQRFPVQKVIQLRRRLEAASAMKPGTVSGSPALPNRASTPAHEPPRMPGLAPDESKAAKAASGTHLSTERPNALKLRQRTRPEFGAAPEQSSPVPRSAASSSTTAVGRSEATLWRPVNAVSDTAVAPRPALPLPRADTNRTAGQHFSAEPSTDLLQDAAEQPALPPPISQISFAATDTALPASDATGAVETTVAETRPVDEKQIMEAPPPPVADDREPWYQDEASKHRPGANVVVHKSSFALVDRLAEFWKVPASTVASAIGACGLFLIGCGVVALHAALQKRRP